MPRVIVQSAFHGERYQYGGKLRIEDESLIDEMRDGVQSDSKKMVNLAKLLEEWCTMRDRPSRLRSGVQSQRPYCDVDRDDWLVMGHVIRNAQRLRQRKDVLLSGCKKSMATPW